MVCHVYLCPKKRSRLAGWRGGFSGNANLTGYIMWEFCYIDWGIFYTARRIRYILWPIGYIGRRDWIFGGVVSGWRVRTIR